MWMQVSNYDFHQAVALAVFKTKNLFSNGGFANDF